MKKLSFECELVFFYIGCMFLIFPLFNKGDYFGITEAKWQMLSILTVLFIVLWTCSRLTDGKWIVRDVYTNMLEIFGVIIFISSLISPYGKIAWVGNGARYTGAIFMILMIIMMLYISNSHVNEILDKLMYIFSAGSVILSVWAGLNFVGIDVLGMHENMYEGQVRSFVSGIGNIVFFASYFCMYLPIAFVMYTKASDTKNKIIYGSGVFFGAFAAFISGTDSAVICIFSLLLGLLPLLIRNKDGLIRYIYALIIVMSAGIFSELLGNFSSYGEYAFDNLMKIVIDFHGFEIGMLLCVIMAALVYLLKSRVKILPLKISYYVILALVFGVFLMSYDSLASLFKFDENWGTGRGYAWINAVKIFREEPFIYKLFGNGADTFGRLLVDYMGTNVGVNGQNFDNVHCEYLQYLLSFGLIGLSAYLFILIYTVKGLLKLRDNDFSDAIVFGMIGYMLQAVMGLNQVFTTPLFFILCAVGISLLKNNVETVPVKHGRVNNKPVRK